MPDQKKTWAQYGTWCSPVTSDMACAAVNNVNEPPRVDPVTGHVFWVEEVASEDGRCVLFKYDIVTKQIERWSIGSVSVGTRVHEYGGGSFIVYDDCVYYSDTSDDQIYKQEGQSGGAVQITNSPHKRYADGSYSSKNNVLYYVCEDHGPVKTGKSKEPKNSIVMIDLANGSTETTLVEGADFYASPRISQDGYRLVWVEWNHPNMPWDDGAVCIAIVDHPSNTFDQREFPLHTSMMMPSLNQHNEVLYVHEDTRWWNLYKLDVSDKELNLTPVNSEVGWPTWKLGTQAYDTNPAPGTHEAVVIIGNQTLRVVNTETADVKRVLDTGYDVFSGGVAYSKDGQKVYTIASDGKRFPRVVEVDVMSGETTSLRGDICNPVEDSFISLPQHISFATSERMQANGILYFPKNPEYKTSLDPAPPLLVVTHGGPTSAAKRSLSLKYQFYTSRGFAILDVDHRGSSGYGRDYRNLLKGKWGVYELADIVAGVKELVTLQYVDPNLIFTTGGSAGGYATLSAVTFTNNFTAGSSHYGISDLTLLSSDTHKFESNYLNSLIGSPETHMDVYKERSPINSLEKITTPAIFFHGTDDAVVPINQAEAMYSALKKKGIPTAFIIFPGEAHGFTRLEHKKCALEAEMYFFSKIGKFTLGDITCDIKIDNI